MGKLMPLAAMLAVALVAAAPALARDAPVDPGASDGPLGQGSETDAPFVEPLDEGSGVPLDPNALAGLLPGESGVPLVPVGSDPPESGSIGEGAGAPPLGDDASSDLSEDEDEVLDAAEDAAEDAANNATDDQPSTDPALTEDTTTPAEGTGGGTTDAPDAGDSAGGTTTGDQEAATGGGDDHAADAKDDGGKEQEAATGGGDDHVADAKDDGGKDDGKRYYGKGKGHYYGKGHYGRDDDEDEDDIEQDVEQEADSGDVEQSLNIINTGDNVNLCVAVLQAANTGNAQNSQTLLQADAESDEIEVEEGSGKITVDPSLVVECQQTINQVATAGGGQPEEKGGTKKKGVEDILKDAERKGGTSTDASGLGSLGPDRQPKASAGAAGASGGGGLPKAAPPGALPRTGGVSGYAALLGLGAGALLIPGGLLVRRVLR